MAVITYENVTPTLIPNTTMRKKFIDGVHKVYTIEAVDGYVLHDKAADVEEINPDTLEPTGRIIFAYASGEKTCGANYDFTTLQVTDETGVTHTAYGAQREFFARLASEVPADQIFGGGDNDHEVM